MSKPIFFHKHPQNFQHSYSHTNILSPSPLQTYTHTNINTKPRQSDGFCNEWRKNYKNGYSNFTYNNNNNTIQKIYCSNCGNHGHSFKQCPEPVISCGVIAIKLDNDIQTKYFVDNINKTNLSIDIDKLNIQHQYQNQSQNSYNLDNYSLFQDSCKFILIKRRHTLGFIEFVRGKYQIDNITLVKYLFKQMIKEELDLVKTLDFSLLWNELWLNDLTHHESEYSKASDKFELLITHNDICKYIDETEIEWTHSEWGFPKGRRLGSESDLECGKREFEEETGFKSDEYVILNNIKPIREDFIGTNGIRYRHIYYVAIIISNKLSNEVDFGDGTKIDKGEIGDINMCTVNESLKLFRPYHLERKRIITLVFITISLMITSFG